MSRKAHGFAVIDGGRPPRGRELEPRRRPGRRSRRVAVFAAFLAFLIAIPVDGTGPRQGEGAGSDDRPLPECRVLSVTDGDTLRIHCPARGIERARLIGLDAPELFSPRCVAEYRAALRARQALKSMIRAADDVALVRAGEDRYGRGRVSLYLDGQSAARAMIDAGHARPYDGGTREGWCDGALPMMRRE